MMTGSNADASVVYSGLLNISVPTTNGTGGIYFDLTLPGSSFIPTTGGGGASEGLNTLLPGWDVNFYRSGAGNLRWYYNGGALAIGASSRVTALPSGSWWMVPLR